MGIATYFVAIIAVCYIALECEAKVYSRCEFAKTLKRNGITSNLGVWTCIAKHESNFNTKAINHQTGDYGILQISHIYWCSDSNKPGKGCNITCKSLLGDNISGDIKCAKKVFDETKRISGNGFTAWTTYKRYCAGNVGSYIAGCGV